MPKSKRTITVDFTVMVQLKNHAAVSVLTAAMMSQTSYLKKTSSFSHAKNHETI